MTSTVLVFVLLSGLMAQSPAPPPPELAGTWVGEVDSPRGQMEIGLSLAIVKDRLTGVLKTLHGDWPVTRMTDKDGVWTVEMKSPEGTATISGRVKGTTFSGDWRAPATDGTFSMVRSKRQ